jgi:PBSX family phage terminase large subunit
MDVSTLATAWAERVTGAPAHVLFSRQNWELRGNNARLHELTHVDELLLVGAAGTGKTLAILAFLHEVAWTYPGARLLIVRKVRADLAESVLVTYERDILGYDNPICANIQRENRMVYRYPNRSIIVIAGMDRPGKALSSEWDIIYAAEATQLKLDDWETLVQRNRSTAVPFQMVIGDTNPDRPDHWLKQRADEGLVTLLNTYHQDNPKYWDAQKQDWTSDGVNYVLGKLHRLTGVRRARFLEGKWVIAEGAIYEDWRDEVHVIPRMEIPKHWRRIRVVDFGYTHPFVCQWWAVDGDGRMYLYREIYRTRRLVSDLAAQIKQLSEGEKIEATICDHDAEGMAQLRAAGIQTTPAQKAVKTGIEAVSLRLRDAGDGKPRIFIIRDALVERDLDLEESKLPLCTKDEIPGYVWADSKKKEEPVKEDDHGCDAMRYAAMYLDTSRGVAATAKAIGFRGGRNRRGRR